MKKELEVIFVRVDKELHIKLKTLCILQGLTMREYIENMLKEKVL